MSFLVALRLRIGPRHQSIWTAFRGQFGRVSLKQRDGLLRLTFLQQKVREFERKLRNRSDDESLSVPLDGQAVEMEFSQRLRFFNDIVETCRVEARWRY